MNFSPIDTPRLLIRESAIGDAPAFSDYNERPEFFKFLTEAQLFTKQKTKDYVARIVLHNLQRPRLYWYLAIVEKESGRLIGDVVLHRNTEILENGRIGFGMSPDYWGQGLMTEALHAVTDFAHEKLGLQHIQTGVDIDNTGSWRVLEKCDYVRGKQLTVTPTNDGSDQMFEYLSVKTN